MSPSLKKCYRLWTTKPLWFQITIALVLGLLAGILFGEKVTFIKPMGEMFIKAIKMLIIPLIFSSLITSVTSTSNLQLLGRMAIRSLTIYLITTAFSISIGLIVGIGIKPGIGGNLPLPSQHSSTVSPMPTLTEILVNLVPDNPIKAMVEGNILQVIVFALLLGVCRTYGKLR